MTTTPEGRRELKALAEAAAPGPWSTEHTCFDRKIPINGGITAFGRPYVIAHVNRPGSAHAGRDKANAAFIAAANPATVLSLLAALEEAEAVLKVVRETIPMDYLERHPGDIPSAMRDYAKDRWTLIDRITETRASAVASEQRAEELRDISLDLLASLVAAVSLLEAVPKTQKGRVKAPMAPSDRMFRQMLADYNASISRARAALTKSETHSDV